MLVTIAVTSASAEKAMSKVKPVKNRLRSTMTDDYFSSLLIVIGVNFYKAARLEPPPHFLNS